MVYIAGRKFIEKLIHRDDINEEMRLIAGSKTDYITPTGKVYKDYGNNMFYPKKASVNNHNGYMYIGITYYKNGTIYEGTLKHNRHHGFGKLTQLDGEIFRGDWKNVKINGTGIRLHSNGDKYIGSYVNNIRNGQGHYIFINGD